MPIMVTHGQQDTALPEEDEGGRPLLEEEEQDLLWKLPMAALHCWMDTPMVKGDVLTGLVSQSIICKQGGRGVEIVLGVEG